MSAPLKFVSQQLNTPGGGGDVVLLAGVSGQFIRVAKLIVWGVEGNAEWELNDGTNIIAADLVSQAPVDYGAPPIGQDTLWTLPDGASLLAFLQGSSASLGYALWYYQY